MQPSFDNAGVGTSDVLSSNSTELPSVRFVWSLRLICAVAMGISLYLAWTAFRMGNVYGCSSGDVIDCEHVLTSHWSKVLGVPVSVPAAGLYASLIALLGFARRSGPVSLRRLVWGGMTLGSVMAGLAALWFIGLQVFEFKFCPYCMTVHACGIAMAGTMLASRFCPAPLKLRSASISVLGVAALVGIQAATPKADQFEFVRYDDADPAVSISEGVLVEGMEPDVFAAPVDVFEAPGEAFAAPVDVFEAPVAGDSASESNSVGTENSTAQPGEPTPTEKQPSVATTLLMVSPPRLLQLSHLLLATFPRTEDESAKPTDAVAVEGPAGTPVDESANAADDDQKDTEATTDSTPTEAARTEDTEKPTVVVPAVEAPKPPERRLLTFAGNRFTLDIKQWPLLGSVDAKCVFVEMFDYTCPHCRNTHHAISGAQKQFGDDLAIFALPVPLEYACNPAASGGGHPGACEMAKIAVAVWRLDPGKFQAFHDWMFAGQRTVSSARAHAETLVDKKRLSAELSSSIPGQYISRHVSLYQRVGSGQVPKLIFPKTTMQGEVNSTTTLCNTIKNELK